MSLWFALPGLRFDQAAGGGLIHRARVILREAAAAALAHAGRRSQADDRMDRAAERCAPGRHAQGRARFHHHHTGLKEKTMNQDAFNMYGSQGTSSGSVPSANGVNLYRRNVGKARGPDRAAKRPGGASARRAPMWRRRCPHAGDGPCRCSRAHARRAGRASGSPRPPGGSCWQSRRWSAGDTAAAAPTRRIRRQRA